MIKHRDQKQLGEDVVFQCTCSSHSRPWSGYKAGTQGMDLEAGTEAGCEGSLCADLLLDSRHLHATAAGLGDCLVVLASPKHWFLHCNLAAPSPVTSSGPVTLLHGGVH